jgi:hypothetical protein
MLHNVSNRQALLAVLFILGSSRILSQVNIKERVEIHPAPPVRATTTGAQVDGPLFEPGYCSVQTRRPCTITATCTLPAYDSQYNIPTDLIALTLIGVGTPQPEYWLGTSNASGMSTPPVTLTAPSCATMQIYNYVGQMGDLGGCVLNVTPTSAVFQLSGTWRRKPISATVTLTAEADTSYDLASIGIKASPTSITQCYDYATITISTLNKLGQPYCSMTCNGGLPSCYGTEQMTVSVPPESKATIEYPRGDSTIRGKSLDIPLGDKVFYLRFNYAAGDPAGSVVVTVTSGDKSAQATVNLIIDPSTSYLTADVLPGEVRHNLKSIINAHVLDGCGKTLTPPEGTTFRFEIIDYPQFGYLYDPATGNAGTVLEGVRHVQGVASVEYRAYGEDPPQEEDIPLLISISDESVGLFQTDIYVEPNQLRVTAAQNPIHFGEATQLTVEKKNRDETYTAIPSNWQTAFQLVEVDTNGYLYSPDSLQTGSTVNGLFQTASYYARPRQVEPDSVDVAIFVTTVDPDVIISKVNDGEEPIPTAQTKKGVRQATKGTKPGGNKNIIAMDDLPNLGPGLPYKGVGRLVVKKSREEGLDHFLVLVSRDTIAHRDACVFFVIAQSSDNKEVALDSGKIVTFNVDSSQYGSYLSNNSIRMDTSTIQVPYGLARAGEIQYASDGIDPLLLRPKTLNFKMYLREDQTKNGVARITILGRAIITIRLSKSELKPLGDSHNKKADPTCVSLLEGDTCRKVIDFSKVDTCTLILSVKDPFGRGIANYPFWIQTGVRDNSGGHDHSVGRLTGRLVTSDKDTLKLYRGKTDTTGRSVFKYLCSGFGGFDSVYAEGLTKKDTATMTIVVKMGIFDSLGTGPHYVLIGQYGTDDVTSKHRMNHYGIPAMVKTLKDLADSANAYHSWVFQYNDMSLELGGPFDIRNDWNTPHQSHRQGKSVDVRPVSTTGDLIDVEWLETKVKKVFNGTLQEEAKGRPGHHFHLNF